LIFSLAFLRAVFDYASLAPLMPAIIFAFTLPHYFSFRHFIDIDALIEPLRRRPRIAAS
jgi:hypothetical protein